MEFPSFLYLMVAFSAAALVGLARAAALRDRPRRADGGGLGRPNGRNAPRRERRRQSPRRAA